MNDNTVTATRVWWDTTSTVYKTCKRCGIERQARKDAAPYCKDCKEWAQADGWAA